MTKIKDSVTKPHEQKRHTEKKFRQFTISSDASVQTFIYSRTSEKRGNFHLYLVPGRFFPLATQYQDKEESTIQFDPVSGYVDMSIYF